jgi:hypothetical protein
MHATKEIDHAAYAKDCRSRSEAELLFIIADCRATLAAWPDQPNHGYYADEISYCAQELNRRQKGGRRSRRPAPAMAALVAARAGNLSDDQVDELRDMDAGQLADELQYLADYQF